MKKRLRVVIGLSLVGAVVVALVPVVVGAVTTPDVLSVMNGVITGVLGAGKDAYCALGVAAMC